MFSFTYTLVICCCLRVSFVVVSIPVVNYYSFPHYSVEVAMNLMDRYLAKHVPPEKRTMKCLHLLILTSLYLALKLTTPQRPPPGIFVRLARAQFTIAQMEATELALLRGLDYFVHPPTAEDYVHAMLDAVLVYPAHILQHVEQSTCQILRKTLGDYMWVQYPPSAVALGAISWSLYQCPDFYNHAVYPSPLTELHRVGVMVDAAQATQVWQYLCHLTHIPVSRKRERQTASPVSCLVPQPEESSAHVIIVDQDDDEGEE